MKRKGYLFQQICTMDNLREAEQNASKGKRKRKEVIKFREQLDNNLLQLQMELITHTYTTSKYTMFVKYEPKKREIFKLPYRDRIVQWAIIQIIEPVWVKCFSSDTFSCIKGRGIHSLLHKMRQQLHDDPGNTLYSLKTDVHKFYPSISHDILKGVIQRKIKDADLLWLLDNIIESSDGVPIGNFISSYFANLYLSDFDHDVKGVFGLKNNLKALKAYACIYTERYRHIYNTNETDAEIFSKWEKSVKAFKYYLRYADDQNFLSSDKIFLSVLVDLNGLYLATEKHLEIKSNWQIYPVESRGIDFVGYVTRHMYCLARKRNKKALCRVVAKLNKKGLTGEEIRLNVASRMGFMVHCDSKNLIKKLGVMKKISDVKDINGQMLGDKLNIEEILFDEIHLMAYTIKPSKVNDRDCLTFQYERNEPMKDENGKPLLDEDGNPVNSWVKHITFSGSRTLMEDMNGLDLTEPLRAKIVKQQCKGSNRCFFRLVDPD